MCTYEYEWVFIIIHCFCLTISKGFQLFLKYDFNSYHFVYLWTSIFNGDSTLYMWKVFFCFVNWCIYCTYSYSYLYLGKQHWISETCCLIRYISHFKHLTDAGFWILEINIIFPMNLYSFLEEQLNNLKKCCLIQFKAANQNLFHL